MQAAPIAAESVMRSISVVDGAIVHRARIRVRYADTDQMQIVYNGKYLEYFEVGRTELLRDCGLPYAEIEREGIRFPLVEAHCRFHAPARYDDLLHVITEVREYRSPRLRIDYRIVREHEPDRTLVSGYTVHAFQDIVTGRATRPFPRFVTTLDLLFASTEPSNPLISKG